MKSVLISIQPYYVFLIIARLMGWKIPEHKTVEVRKNFPKDLAWNKKAYIYCSKNKKSFDRIPKIYQTLMKELLGKVIGEFICDNIRKGRGDNAIAAYYHNNPEETCLTDLEIRLYATYGKPLYFWHISALTVYDTPKELSDFRVYCEGKECFNCKHSERKLYSLECSQLDCPPQSWCYVGA